jgi:hypothetical protein
MWNALTTETRTDRVKNSTNFMTEAQGGGSVWKRAMRREGAVKSVYMKLLIAHGCSDVVLPRMRKKN